MEKLFWDLLGDFIIYFPCIIWGGLGLYLIIHGLVCVARIFSCTELVDGYCAFKEKVFKVRGNELRCFFNYRYEGKDYYSRLKYGLTPKIFNYMEVGDKFVIYVNEKKPEFFVVERKITIYELVSIGLGMFFIAGAIYSVVK